MSEKEKVYTHRHVDALNILVHPLYLDEEDLPAESYSNSRGRLMENAIDRFTPKTSGEVTFIMPNLQTWHKPFRELSEIKKMKRENPDSRSWADIYRAIKGTTNFSGNVRLIENFGSGNVPADVVLSKLALIGFFLDATTEITFGGEQLDVCVDTAAQKVLKLPQVTRVRIDKEVVTPSQDFAIFGYIPFPVKSPHRFTEDDEYYYLHRGIVV